MTDTTIRIKKNVKKELGKIGSTDQSYSDVVEMLLRFYKENNNGNS